MSVVVIGLEHHSAPLALLERVSVGDQEFPKVLGQLRDRSNLQESVLLSTCLRAEVYAVVDRFHEAVTEVEELFAERAGMAVEELEPFMQIRYDDDVAHHLFSVAAGLESAVLGEPEVLGQVRRAAERAHREHTSGPVLSELFRQAVRAGRRVRSETAISRGSTSFAHAAVEMAARRRAAGLAGATAVVLGAGEVGSGVVGALAKLPAGSAPERVVIVSRTMERANQLMETATATTGTSTTLQAAPLGALRELLTGADLLFTAVEADRAIVTEAHLPLSGRREDRPLLVVDLGMPRNVDRCVDEHPGVLLFDMDDLRSAVEDVMAERHGEVDEARAIVAAELAEYQATSRARAVTPVIVALRSRLEGIRAAELARRRAQFESISDQEWSRVESATQAMMAKFLHEPTMMLKETAGTPRGERLVEALRVLFDL